MTTDDLHPPLQHEETAGHDDPDVLPLAHLGRPQHDPIEHADDLAHPPRVWWYVGVTAAVVVVGLVVGIVVFNRSAPTGEHGARSADEAATQFVAALNAGSERRAAAIACDAFVDGARAAARTGKDPSIGYRLDAVRGAGEGTATAVITEVLRLPSGVQREQANVSVLRENGLWLACGRIG